MNKYFHRRPIKKIRLRLGIQKLHSSRGKIKVSSETMRRKKIMQDEDKQAQKLVKVDALDLSL